MIDLRALGSLDVRSDAGSPIESLLSQPKRAALFVYLALATPTGFRRRDALLATFWPELDTERARGALRQAVYQLRQTLGERLIVSRGQEEIGVESSLVRCDVREFELALDGHREEAALSLYRGPLLDAFFISDAPSFEQWLERERSRLSARAAAGAFALAERCATAGNHDAAAEWGERALQLSADDEIMLRRLVSLRSASGDRVGAIRMYEKFSTRLRREYEIQPSPDTQALVASLRGTDGARQSAVFAKVRSRAEQTIVPPATPPTQGRPAALPESTPSLGAEGRSPRVLWSALLIIAVLFATVLQRRTPNDRGGGPVRDLEIVLPDSAPLALRGEGLIRLGRAAIAVAPDGRSAVYVAKLETTTQLYLRRFDDAEPRPLQGTQGAFEPFYSPDSHWIGFFVGAVLKKVSVENGEVVTLGHIPNPGGASWGRNHRILVADDEGRRLAWLSEEGGAPELLPRQPQVRYVWTPQLLPDCRWLLHASLDHALYLTSLESGLSYVVTHQGLVIRDSADPRAIVRGANPRYAASGHIIYSMLDGTLMALPFDVARRAVLGPAIPILHGVAQLADVGGGVLGFSDEGTLVYAKGASLESRRFAWVDSLGHVDTLRVAPAAFGPFALSTNGRKIVVRVEGAGSRGELWVVDLARETHTVIPATDAPGFLPQWWPDNEHVVYTDVPWRRDHFGPVLRATESGQIDTLVRSAYVGIPSHDGSHLAVGGYPGLAGLRLLSLNHAEARGIELSPGFQSFASFSPDDQWIAFNDPTVTSEIYAVRISDPKKRIQISENGGVEPVWSPNGKQIFFRRGANLLVVDFHPERDPPFTTPRILASGPFLKVPGRSHDVSPDGRRHLVILAPAQETTTRLHYVSGWFDQIRKYAAASR